MSQQIRGQDSASVAGTTAQVSSSGAVNTVTQGPDIGSVGSRNMVTTRSGVLATIAAVTASAGHLWALKNATATATKLILVHRLTVRFRPTVAATVAQQLGLCVFRATAFTTQHNTGGALVSFTTPQAKMRTSLPLTEATVYASDSTTAISGGTLTIDTLPLFEQRDWNLASGATVPFPLIDFTLDFKERPLVLAQNEGLVVANTVLFANSLAGPLNVTCEWSDVASYGQ